MKNKKLALLSFGLVAAVAGVATSSAFLYEAATAQQSGVLDQGIILQWDVENSDTTNIDNLTIGSYVYRKVTVKAPIASETLTGNVVVNFNLVQDDHIKVEILKNVAWETAASGTEANGEIGNLSADWSDTIPLASFNENVFYSLRISAAQTDGAGTEATSSNGTITVSLAYNA